MTLGSLFDGIGGWLVAASHFNVKPLWSSEIDDFPAAVTAYHFPDVKQYGDITKLNGAELEPVDILCAGSPCQDLSVAGKQKGLDGERSCLFHEAVRIVREMRKVTNGEYPKYFVWENVPGAFSTHKGADFKAVLSEITEAEIPMPESGKWAEAGMVRSDLCNVEWRVLDAQYWGVPQRRKRIFLVADFTNGHSGEILFECEGLPRDSEESQGAVQEAPRYAGGSSGETVGAVGFDGYNSALTGEKAATIGVNCGMSTGRNGILHTGGTPDSSNTANKLITCYNMGQPSNNFEPYTEGGGVSPTLISRMGTGGNQVPIIDSHNLTVFENRHDEGVRLVTGDKSNTITAAMGEGGGNIPCVHAYADVASTLRAGAGAPKHMSDIKGRIVQTYALQGSMIGRKVENGPQGNGINDEVSFTLNTTDRHAVCIGNGQLHQVEPSDKVGALNCMHDQQCVMVGFMPQQKAESMVPLVEKSPALVNGTNPGFHNGVYQKPVRSSSFGGYKDAEKACSLKAAGGDLGGGSENMVYQKTIGSLCADDHKGINNQYVGQDKCVIQKSVRRLTPVECERLQGLPDGYTDIEFKGKPAPDSRRYKALGNGMAQPCADYVIKRICLSAH